VCKGLLLKGVRFAGSGGPSGEGVEKGSDKLLLGVHPNGAATTLVADGSRIGAPQELC